MEIDSGTRPCLVVKVFFTLFNRINSWWFLERVGFAKDLYGLGKIMVFYNYMFNGSPLLYGNIVACGFLVTYFPLTSLLLPHYNKRNLYYINFIHNYTIIEIYLDYFLIFNVFVINMNTIKKNSYTSVKYSNIKIYLILSKNFTS